jgi:hypothetical protein
MTIQLSQVAPDFADLVTQLQTELSTKNTWTDRLTSSTGQTLIEMIAAIGAYSQYSVESSYQEVWPESAKNANSLFAASNFAGVRINRKLPASVAVSMNAVVPTTIPPFTQFVGAGNYWFNRTAITLTPTLTEFTLHQGKKISTQMTGLGTDFQAFVSAEKDFQVSDVDVTLSINNVSIPVTIEGLWLKQKLPGIWQFTLPAGQLIILFGNDIYGTKPITSDVCTITYFVTQGRDGNNLQTVGKTVTVENDNSLGGKFTTVPSNGASQTNPLVYKNVTPALFGAFNSSITPSQYKKLPLLYPGVIDAQVLAQRDINPQALNWMNVFKVSLLTSTPLTTAQFAAFEDFFNRNTMYSGRIHREDPVASTQAISAEIYCTNFSDLTSIVAKVNTALTTLFSPRQGILGLDLYVSDIIDTIKDADSNIEYVKLLSPTTDIILSSQDVAVPALASVPGGSLAPNQYSYSVSVVSSLGGETAPAKWGSFTTTTTGSNSVTWKAVQSALSYKVWGRNSSAGLGLLAILPATSASTYTFLDTGTLTPVTPLNPESTIPVFYPTLGSLTITPFYSSRNLKLDQGI